MVDPQVTMVFKFAFCMFTRPGNPSLSHHEPGPKAHHESVLTGTCPSFPEKNHPVIMRVEFIMVS